MPHALAEPNRILIVRPSALGDVCRSVPVLAALRARWPDARIDWLVQDAYAPAIAAHPALSEAVIFPRRALSPATRPDRLLAAVRWARSLRNRRYDLVLDCQGLLRSGLMALATGAPVRVGDAAARELAWLAYTRRVPTQADQHTVDRMLALAQAAIEHYGPCGPIAGADMRLYTSPEDKARAQAVLAPAGEAPLVVLAPTSRWPAKQWPDERFAQLGQRLLEHRRLALAIVGGPGEADQCPKTRALAQAHDRVVDLVGRTDVGTLMGVVERADLVVANDSAVLHMAVGFGRPLVALFGPTLTELVGPYRRQQDVIQRARPDRPGLHKLASAAGMMQAIEVADVLERALARLSRDAAQTPA
ncbi:MAG: LPS heptosyltransferase-1 [Phycisphaerales bacterium]|nr:MAG: LPS heptosyltransferase-1 [Phycisphaerales bacterium]